MAHSILDVAAEVLFALGGKATASCITFHTYCAHGFYLVGFNAPLVNEEWETAPSGPRSPVLSTGLRTHRLDVSEVKGGDRSRLVEDMGAKRAIQMSLSVFQDYNYAQRSLFLIREGSAWDEANLRSLEVIPNELTLVEFKEFMDVEEKDEHGIVNTVLNLDEIKTGAVLTGPQALAFRDAMEFVSRFRDNMDNSGPEGQSEMYNLANSIIEAWEKEYPQCP